MQSQNYKKIHLMNMDFEDSVYDDINNIHAEKKIIDY
jgi:hypothetical protein